MSAFKALLCTRLTLPQLLIVFAVLSGVLFSLAWLVPRSAVIDIGESDATLSGFYPPEIGPQSRYRWTSESSAVTFPGIGASTWQIQVTLATQRTPAAPMPTVEVYSGQQLLATLHPTESNFQTYSIDAPARNSMSDDVILTINTTPIYSPEGEPRALGIAMDRITLTPTATELPSILHLALLVLAVLLFVLALEIIGGRFVACIGGLVFALMLAGFLAWNKLWITPFSLYVPLMSATLAAVTLLHRALVSYYLHRITIEAKAQQVTN
jgi:hypothetical protein